MEGGITQEEPLVSCPVCLVELPAARINSHLDSCLQLQGEGEDLPSGEVGGRSNSAPKPAARVGLPPLAQQPCFKKMRLSQSPERRNKDEEPGSDLGSPPVFSLFHRGRNTGGAQMGAPRGAATSPNPGKGEERRVENPEPASDALEPLLRGESLAQKLEGKPLADKLRPSHLGDYVGQNQVLGKETLLRSLVEALEIPSLILWGPPGCGKTTLARIIANSSKKNGTRFVTLSATSAKTSDVRDVIFQAQNEKRLCKRKTILFIDEIHRFNKSQQDTFLPHVECGTITLIGATTENPSFQVNSALLSRCRVIVLEKLSVEAMEAILMRAVKSLGIQVLSQDEEPTSSMNANNSKGSDELLGTRAAQQIVGKLPSAHSKYTGSRRQLAWPFLISSSFRAPSKRVQTGRPPYWAFICLHGGKERLCVCIEKTAINTLAYLCDGDARTGLNGLQMAVQARLTSTSHQDNNHECSAKRMVITEDHVKEGLQRSHILYDRAGEEHYNCISALHKSMRGSDENASLYWLARMLEGGEDPLYVARRLVRFASEDIGLADPLALPQAVAAYQGCHFIGMPECEVLLAQCVVYFARAPKSIEVYRAYSNVKACLRDHQGPLPPVPLHLRNAPTRLMKNLGYGKDYKYNPMYKNPVEQEYLPEGLKEIDFFTQSKI